MTTFPETQMVSIDALKPDPRNTRTHSKKQIREIANSIVAFGFVFPIVTDENFKIIAGHGRYEAAKLLGLEKVPVIVARGLSPAKRRALALADNKLAQNSGWDRERLAAEVLELKEILVGEGLDIAITGFAPVEIDQLVIDFEENSADPADDVDPDWIEAPPVTKRGDVWKLGPHLLSCGDARNAADLARLMGDNRAAMGIFDPPYNVRVKDIVGRGKIKHAEFAMASGELPRAEFVSFLDKALSTAAAFCRVGAVHYVCMDWRHIGELLEAGAKVYDTTLNLAVWVKTNPGQGSLYRSQHELIGIFRVGRAPHLNNIELGRHGRTRSNVWNYPGVNTFRAGRLDDLQAHPTVKPIALVADAMKDVTRRRDIVLDTFCGSGTTILAAERVGRRAFGLEIEPRFVDVAIRRWQAFTRQDAIHVQSNLTFDELARGRAAQCADAAPTNVR